MAFNTLSIDDLFDELTDLARNQAAEDQETWNGLIEEVIEGHLDAGEMDADDDVVGMKEVLRARWQEYKERQGEESEAAMEEEIR